MRQKASGVLSECREIVHGYLIRREPMDRDMLVEQLMNHAAQDKGATFLRGMDITHTVSRQSHACTIRPISTALHGQG
jgi:hypothetical protein